MPGEFFAQSEAGSRGLRDTRRSQPGFAAKKGFNSKQGGAFGENFHNENSHFSSGRFETNSRRSPRLSNFAAANKNYAGGRGGADRFGMDITNVTAGRSSVLDKAKATKPSYQSFQPPSATTTSREVPAVAPSGSAAPAPGPAPAPERIQERKSFEVSRDPQLVQEYVPDIINQLFSSEALALPPADYMDKQTDITAKMRMILIDWLIEVHMKYRLRPETLHLTVNLIDRYLSKKQITRKRLQLVGVAAMFIASKFEEITPPELRDWVYITDNAYTKDDVLMMECNMLATLNFKVVVPTAAHFFDHFATANVCDNVHRSFAQYVMELGLLDMRMLQYKPSHMVAAALLLSNELFARSTVWPDAMITESRNSEQTLRHCAEELRQLWKADRAGAGGQLQAVHKKFSTAQCNSVATKSF